MIFKPTSSQMSFCTGNTDIDSYLWNQGVMQVFTKRYSYKQLNDAYNRLVHFNDSLRIKIEFAESDCVLRLKEYEYKNYPHWILSSEEELEKKSREFLNEPIDFTGDFVKCAIFETPDISGIMISGHHMFVDGYSVTVMTEHINKYLENPEYIPPVHQEYTEYVQNEEKHKNSKRYNLDYNFWDEKFNPMPSCSIFQKHNISFDYTSSEVNAKISVETFDRIRKLCSSEEVSIQSFFNAVYTTCFHRLADLNKFTLGIPVLNRTTAAEFNTIGLYMHIVPLIIENKKESCFSALTQEIEDSQMTLLRHQKFTQIEIKKILQDKGVEINSLFDVVSDYQKFNYNDAYEIRLPYSNHLSIPMEIHMQSFGDKKHNIKIRYRTSMFSEKEIQTMLNSFIAIIEDALENPEKKISELSMILSEEKNKVLYEFNDTVHNYNVPDNSTLYSLFEKTARENLDKVCIKTADESVTYRKLLNVSETLDTEIRKITEGKKSVVAIIAERSAEMYSAIYSIIRGGNAYLPIDPDYPQERIEYILENSGSAAVVAQGKFSHLAGRTPFINMTELLSGTQKKSVDAPACAAKAEDTAYVIYTSGSTGNPKGARISHKSAVNRILWMHDKYPLGADDVILQKTPYTFDVSVWEHFWWGMCGGGLAVSRPGEHFLPARILDEVNRNKVTHLHFVPSVFELFLNYLETHKEEREKFDSVRYVFLSGEALTANLVQRFYRLYDYEKVTLHNLYGPTECAVDVTYYDCAPDEADPVPIGKPIYNTQMYVVDKYLKPVPIGVTGELCIAGVNVGQGYLNNPELTAEKFIDNPFGEGKMYKTGDLAYWREDGNIIFCGRKDSQIKMGGQRIETGEIEAVISSISEVESVAVLVRKINQRDVLVAFYSGKKNSETMIKEFCRSKLPKYMVPSFVAHLDTLPLNQSGKLDRKALSETEFNAYESEVTAPVNDTERYICSLFEEYLTEENIGRNSDFFDLGGTSLSMISVLSEKGFEKVTAAEFMRNPTPALLAELLDKKSARKAGYVEALYTPKKPKQTLILLPFAGGGAEAYSNFVVSLKKVRNDTAVYFIRYLHSMQECEQAAVEIAEFFEDMEIMLYSHCVGSALALNIISSLERKNIIIKHYFAAATIPPSKPSNNNVWNKVPDRLISAILSNAGADFDGLSHEKLSQLLRRFRKDTDFANISYFEFRNKIKSPVTVILSKKDIFTLNHRQASKLWKRYADSVNDVLYINSNSHYFQSENSNELVGLICGKI